MPGHGLDQVQQSRIRSTGSMWVGILNKFLGWLWEINQVMTPGWSGQGSAHFGQLVKT